MGIEIGNQAANDYYSITGRTATEKTLEELQLFKEAQTKKSPMTEPSKQTTAPEKPEPPKDKTLGEHWKEFKDFFTQSWATAIPANKINKGDTTEASTKKPQKESGQSNPVDDLLPDAASDVLNTMDKPVQATQTEQEDKPMSALISELSDAVAKSPTPSESKKELPAAKKEEIMQDIKPAPSDKPSFDNIKKPEQSEEDKPMSALISELSDAVAKSPTPSESKKELPAPIKAIIAKRTTEQEDKPITNKSEKTPVAKEKAPTTAKEVLDKRLKPQVNPEQPAKNPEDKKEISDNKFSIEKGQTLGDLVTANKAELAKKHGTEKVWGEGGLVDKVAKSNGFKGFNDPNLNKIKAGQEFQLNAKKQTTKTPAASTPKSNDWVNPDTNEKFGSEADIKKKSAQNPTAPEWINPDTGKPFAPKSESTNSIASVPTKNEWINPDTGKPFEPKVDIAAKQQPSQDVAKAQNTKKTDNAQTAQKAEFTPEQQKVLNSKIENHISREKELVSSLKGWLVKSQQPKLMEEAAECEKLINELQNNKQGSVSEKMAKIKIINSKLSQLVDNAKPPQKEKPVNLPKLNGEEVAA